MLPVPFLFILRSILVYLVCKIILVFHLYYGTSWSCSYTSRVSDYERTTFSAQYGKLPHMLDKKHNICMGMGQYCIDIAIVSNNIQLESSQQGRLQ